MKKIFSKKMSMFLVLTIMLLMFTGCSNNNEKPAEVEKPVEVEKPEESAEGTTDYPTKSIELVVPFGPGGDTDTNARVISKYMSEELGQPVVVTNIEGASGVVGSAEVMDSDPDGYRVLFNHPTMLISSLLGVADYTYEDFEMAGISLFDDANVFVVSADSEYENLEDIIEEAKKRPNELLFATSLGSFTHLQILAFQEETGTEISEAVLGDMASYVVALLDNKIDIIGAQYGVVKDYIETGDFKVVGVLSEERNPLIPDVPTFKEQGVDVAFTKMFYHLMPKGTPAEIVEKYSKALEAVTLNEEYIKEAGTVFVTPNYLPPTEASEYVANEVEKYKKYTDKMEGK